MSPLSRIAQLLLITHGLLNIAQGIYSLVSLQEYAALGGDIFAGAPDKALKSIGEYSVHQTIPHQSANRRTGLGAIGVGWYELIFAWQYNRALILSTIPMRLMFAAVISSWGNTGAVTYEVGVALVCGLALLA
jgi:hypothetical protein